jgi:PAS domain S-box-containing protein
MPTTVLRRPPSRLQRQLAAFGPAMVVLILGTLMFVNVKLARDSRDERTRGGTVLVTTTRLLTQLLDAEGAKRGYLLTNQEIYYRRYIAATDSASQAYDLLRELIGRSVTHYDEVRALDTLIPIKLTELRKPVVLQKTEHWAEISPLSEMNRSDTIMMQIRHTLNTIRATEQGLFDLRQFQQDQSENRALIITLVGTTIAVLLGLLANVFLTRYVDAQARAAGESAKRSRRATEVAFQQTTARRAAEEALDEFRRIFSQAPFAISVLRGPNHIIEIANDPFYKLTGRGPEILGKPIREAFPELEEQLFLKIDEAYKTGIAYIGKEVKIAFRSTLTRRETTGIFNYVYQPLINDSGSVYGIAIVAHDVTELVEARNELEIANVALRDAASRLEEQTTELEQQMEESLAYQEERDRALAIAQEAQRTAEAANLAKTQFLATMSHELRTPLNAVNGYAELMLLGIAGEITDQQKDFLNRISRSGRYLLALINDILNYAKLEAGRVEFHIEKISIDTALRSIEPMVALQVAANGLTYHYDPADPELMVYADAERVRQIVLNLVSNAIKFTPGGGSVTLSCKSDKNQAYIYVSDTGCGISPDKLATIFDPFVQVDRHLTSTGSQQGVGLGLAISRDLARQMKGDLTVISEVGVGSQFTLTLPLAK